MFREFLDFNFEFEVPLVDLKKNTVERLG